MLKEVLLAAALAATPPLPARAGGAGAAPAPPACPGNPDALGTARTLALDPARLPPVGFKTYPHTLGLADHEVVLTFDDGPLPRTTPRVLDALAHECVRATFFLVGRNAAAAPALVRREVAEGHTVGHHSWSHPAVTERGLPDAEARADIDRGFRADDLAAYGRAGPEPRVPFFRFPGFADTPALTAWLRGRGVAVFGADLWASDWIEQTPGEELDRLMGRLDKAGGGIVLLHDIKRQTADMLPALLRALKAKGYRVVALAPGPEAAPLREAPAGWRSETEATLAASRPRPAGPASMAGLRRTLHPGPPGAQPPAAGAPMLPVPPPDEGTREGPADGGDGTAP